MQLYALDSEGQPCFARSAVRQRDYYCLECQGVVHLRGGSQRQLHFYHIHAAKGCHLSGKGMAHLQAQLAIFDSLPPDERRLELPFPSIKRIADVAWTVKKIVFEIQCSPISAQEIRSRTSDYKTLGWQVIWIFHDQRYNKAILTSAEAAVLSSPHYFTNIDEKGEGIFYDQIEIDQRGSRYILSVPLTITLSAVLPVPTLKAFKSLLSRRRKERLQSWPFYFKGDLLDLMLQGELSSEWKEGLQQSLLNERGLLKNVRTWMKWIKLMSRPYFLLFDSLLEKLCR